MQDEHERIRKIVQGDRLFHLYEMQLLEASEGFAKVGAIVKEEFLNAHHLAHGGLIFALLDVAFAVAVNSVIDSVGVQFSFNIFRSSLLGELIIAEAKVIHRGRSMLVVEVKAVSRETGKLIAQGNATALPLPRTKKED